MWILIYWHTLRLGRLWQSEAVSLCPPTPLWTNKIIGHVQWTGCSLSSLRVYQAMPSFKAFWFINFTVFVVSFGVEMLDQSVKLSRLIIFHFISNFLIFQTDSQKPVLFAVLSFLEQFFSSSTVVSVAKANVLQTPTIAVFARHWSGVDPNFATFRWRIWLALSELILLFISQSECHVYYSFLH